jgi:hypothetical protein
MDLDLSTIVELDLKIESYSRLFLKKRLTIGIIIPLAAKQFTKMKNFVE